MQGVILECLEQACKISRQVLSQRTCDDDFSLSFSGAKKTLGFLNLVVIDFW
jgi:hypothetical protein